jgi:invasion protein IalB
MELSATDEAANGMLLLPFGLLLERGVTLAIDDGEPGPPLRVRTCLPAGCVVRLSFDAEMVDDLAAGTALTLGAVAAENDQPVELKMSLNGFASAFERAADLAR